jgi:hypothetical protein
MPSINGVDFNNINSMNGVSWNSVDNIGNVPITHGPTCTIVRLGLSDGRKNPPSFACTSAPGGFLYDFDATNNLLYSSNNCGISFSGPGYYSDGITIFYWDGSSSWTVFGACPR